MIEKKSRFFSSIKTRTTFYIITPVVITFIITCSVLFVYLFNSQQRLAIAEFQNIAGYDFVYLRFFNAL